MTILDSDAVPEYYTDFYHHKSNFHHYSCLPYNKSSTDDYSDFRSRTDDPCVDHTLAIYNTDPVL